jgi:hypothetical protein
MIAAYYHGSNFVPEPMKQQAIEMLREVERHGSVGAHCSRVKLWTAARDPSASE